MNLVEKGKTYEEKAAVFLQKQGMQLLFKNYRCRQGEIDLVGIHENCLVFVEVKYRKSASRGRPEEAVGVQKQIKICRTSDYFRIYHRQYASMQIRYDVVAICGEELKWYKNAFPYQESRSLNRW